MPKFKLTDNETGKSVVVNGDSPPTEAEAQQIFADAGFHHASQAAPQEKPSSFVDSIRSIPGGLAQGVASVAGLPGDVMSLANKGMDKVEQLLGHSPEQIAAHNKAVSENPATLPTGSQINEDVSRPFGGYYEPQTTAGQYAQTIASFAPNALMPGSAVARAARVVVPGVASETAGQLTKGKKYEGAARAAGALVGGIGEGMAESKLASHAVMSMDELKSAKDAAYKAADHAGVVISPKAFQTFADDLSSDISTQNVVQPELHKNAVAALNTIQSEAKSGAPISLERADAIRQVVNNAIEAAGKNNGGDLRLASKIKAGLDKFLDGLTPGDTLSGDASVAVPILKEARGLAQREFKAKEIQKIIDLSENQAAGNNSALGTGQALRQQFKNLNARLIKDPQLAKSFSPAERAAIEKVVSGGAVENALRLFGKLAPTNAISMGVGPSLGAAVGAGVGGPAGAAIGAVGVPAMGAAARGGASLMTQRNARLAEELMRSGGQANPGATAIPRNVLLGTLLSQAAH